MTSNEFKKVMEYGQGVSTGYGTSSAQYLIDNAFEVLTLRGSDSYTHRGRAWQVRGLCDEPVLR